MVYQKNHIQSINKTLSYCGLKLYQQIDYRSVKIYDNDHIHQIYTINNKNKQNLPHIVLLHGFGGTGMTFIKIIKKLYQQYQVHALDTFGIGHSSRGEFKNNFTYQQARDYFIDAIQQWRKSLKIQSFTILGHSFGGYLATCYTQKYKQRVNRLILLSPAGCSQKTAKQVQDQLKIRYQNAGFRGVIMKYFAQRIYNLKILPNSLMAKWIIGQKLISMIVDNRFRLQNQQALSWKQYLRLLSKKQTVSQVGFYILFQWPLTPKYTIQNIVSKIDFNKQIQFYFGVSDWMDSKGAQILSQKYQNVKFDKIQNSAHQIIFDNPQQISRFIISRKDLQNQKNY